MMYFMHILLARVLRVARRDGVDDEQAAVMRIECVITIYATGERILLRRYRAADIGPSGTLKCTLYFNGHDTD